MASIGFGNTGGEIFEKGGPYLVRGAQDLIPTSELLDKYSPALFCTIRNYHDVEPKIAASLGGNGYSLNTHSQILFPAQRLRLSGQPAAGERPRRTRGQARLLAARDQDLWPNPYLVMDTGASIAPYNHIELASPFGCAGLPPCLLPPALPLITPGSSTSGAANSGRTRSTHENHRYRRQTRRLRVGAAAVHRDHHRGVRSDAVRPHDRLLGRLQQCQWSARRTVRPRIRGGSRQGLQGRTARQRHAGEGRLRRRARPAAVPGDVGVDPVPEPDRRPLPGAQAGREQSAAARRRNHSDGAHRARTRPGRVDRRLPSAVQGAGPRQGQQHRPVDHHRLPGPGRHHQRHPGPDRRS